MAFKFFPQKLNEAFDIFKYSWSSRMIRDCTYTTELYVGNVLRLCLLEVPADRRVNTTQYRLQTKLGEINVFTQRCHSVRCNYYPWCIGTWDLSPPPISDMWPTTFPLGHQKWKFSPPLLLLLTSGDHHWRPVQTCSLEDLHPQLVLTSGGQVGSMHPNEMHSCTQHPTALSIVYFSYILHSMF